MGASWDVIAVDRQDLMQRIADTEREIAIMPLGSITVKRIRGREYFCHRIIHNGKRTEKHVSFDKISELARGY